MTINLAAHHSTSSFGDPEVRKETDSGGTSDSEIPDGGWGAWSVLFGIWLIHFCASGYIQAFGVYNDFYVREYLQNYTVSDISWIGSFQVFFLAFSGVITGRAYDAGYFYHLIIGGSFLIAFSLFMLSLTHAGQYYQAFLAQAVGIGLGAGLVEIPTFTLVSQYFNRKRALAFGLITTAGAIGAALHSIMLNHVIHGNLGFHNGVRASAGLCVGLLLPGVFLARQRCPPVKHRFRLLCTIRYLVADTPFVLITMGSTLINLGLFFPIFYIQLNAIKNGISPDLAFYTIPILNASSVLGRIIPNLLVRRLGAFNLIIMTVWIVVILIFCTLAVKSAAAILAFAVLYGFFTGSYFGLFFPLLASITDDDTQLGARFGCASGTGAFGALIGNPIASALLTHTFIWWRAFLYAGLCIAAGSICLFTARRLCTKKKGTCWL